MLRLACALLLAPALAFGPPPAVPRAGSSTRRSARPVGTQYSAKTLSDLRKCLYASAARYKAVQACKWTAEAALESDPSDRVKSPLKAESFGVSDAAAGADGELAVALAAARDECVAIIEALAQRSAPAASKPLDGWRGRNGVAPEDCALDGTWELLFTDAADATFRPPANGTDAVPRTFQEISAKRGQFVNCVDLASSTAKLKGFRVVVEGSALNDSEVSLAFRSVVLLRRSKLPRLFGRVKIPLPPPGVVRALARWGSRGKAKLSDRGAGFELKYVDPELRCHKTFDGLYFAQRRCAGA